MPENSLQTAKIEHSLGIRSTYFFRIIPETFKPEIIRQIADLGHEIGYHYEDLTLAADSVGSRQYAVGIEQKAEGSGQKSEVGGQTGSQHVKHVETHGRASTNNNDRASYNNNGRASTNNRRYAIHRVSNTFHRVINAINRALKTIKPKNNKSGTDAPGLSGSCRRTRGERGKEVLTPRAYQLFKTHLEQLRQYVPVKTICMHGSPKSRYDSKDIWKEYDYREQGIIGEPYFDIDFNEVFYLTDTGRRWDGWKVILRDKVPQQETWKKAGLVFQSTKDIIQAAEQNNLPNKIMITTHPQRWTDRPWPWMKELVWQGVKNVVKGILVVRGQKSD